MIKFISISVVSTLGVANCRSWYPWVPLVNVLAIAIFIRVTGVVTMLGTVEFHLIPFPPL